MTLYEQISKDIATAMKAKDKTTLTALRNIKKYFIEAKTAPGANDTLTDDKAIKILTKLAKQGTDAATLYTQQHRPDLAEEEQAQVKVIQRYLPTPLTQEQIEQAIKTIITQTNATSQKDIHKVITTANQQLAGKADGKTISNIVKQLLA